MSKITIERETLKWAIRWHESRIWPGPDEVSVFDALRAALAAQPAEPLFVAAPPSHRLSDARMDGIYNAWRDMGDDVSYGDLMRMVEAEIQGGK